MSGVYLIWIAILLLQTHSIEFTSEVALHTYNTIMLGQVVLLINGQILTSQEDHSSLLAVSYA